MPEIHLTPIERRVALRVLRRAKSRLARTGEQAQKNIKEQFLCHAIRGSAHNAVEESLAEDLTTVIMGRLGYRHCTLESWLVANGHLPYTGWTDDDRTKVQVTRHAWLDSLIVEVGGPAR